MRKGLRMTRLRQNQKRTRMRRRSNRRSRRREKMKEGGMITQLKGKLIYLEEPLRQVRLRGHKSQRGDSWRGGGREERGRKGRRKGGKE